MEEFGFGMMQAMPCYGNTLNDLKEMYLKKHKRIWAGERFRLAFLRPKKRQHKSRHPDAYGIGMAFFGFNWEMCPQEPHLTFGIYALSSRRAKKYILLPKDVRNMIHIMKNCQKPTYSALMLSSKKRFVKHVSPVLAAAIPGNPVFAGFSQQYF